MSERINEFLRNRRTNGQDYAPCLVVDLDIIRKNYEVFARSLPDTRIFYAIKANPDLKILNLLAGLGSCFDAASINEVKQVIGIGVDASRISYGNTIKKQSDIAKAYKLGIRMFAADSVEEVEKIASVAPGSQIFCRILCESGDAQWPLSRKFGCNPSIAADILEHAQKRGLIAEGISFHVGSQQQSPATWDKALKVVAKIFKSLDERGINLSTVNLGGGFPIEYLNKLTPLHSYGEHIFGYLRKHFGNKLPETVIEPGRGMVGNAGIIEAEVVLISKKSYDDEHRWVYLDIGKFGGLIETTDEMIRYSIKTPYDGDKTVPCVIAGPTCDSVDILYEKNPYFLPVSLEIGAKVLIEGTGAYTSSYSSVGFNGFPPLETYVI